MVKRASGAAAVLLLGVLPAGAQPTVVDASEGGVTISSGVNSLTIGARLQFRWTVDDRDRFDADTIGPGVGVEDGPLSWFDVPRMRVTMWGGVFRPWMKYSFQFELSRTEGEGSSRIKDAVFEIRPTGRAYRVQFGQFKAPFGLQQLTSSGRQQFVERAITDSKFAPGRDMGAMASARILGGRVGLEGGVFNGAGESVRQTSESHLRVARAWVQPWGRYELSEGASDGPSRPVLHVGFGIRRGSQIRGRAPEGLVQHPDGQTAVNVEAAFKSGRVFSTAEYFRMRDRQQNPVAGPDLVSRGGHAQAGYTLRPETFELGLRYARVDGDVRARAAAVRELRGVAGYYWRSHQLKVQVDAGRIRYDARYRALPARARAGLPALGPRLAADVPLSDLQLRAQLQLSF